MAIKSTLVTPPNKAKGIDWSKKQYLISKDSNDDNTIVYSTGVHDGESFSACLLFSNYKPHHKQPYANNWAKERFKLLTTPITITFENE